MTTNESFFFRDDKPFQHFRTQALPRLLGARGRRGAAARLVGRIVAPGRRPIRSR